MAWRHRILPLAVLPVLLAGCAADCVRGPAVSARGITDAPSSGGDGDAVVTLSVTLGRGGPPVPGAGVVFYWAGNRVDDYEDREIPEEAGEPRDPVDPGDRAATPQPKQTLTLATDGDGSVQASLPSGRVVGVVAAKDGYTEEWIGYFPASEDATVDLTLPLYRKRIDTWVNDTLPVGGASTGAATDNNRVWDPHEVDLGPDPSGQLARLSSLQARLTWENTPTASGDLGIGVGNEPGDPEVFADEHENVEPGPHEETLEMGRNDVVRYRLSNTSTLYVGASTETAYAAPQGLDYSLELGLTFDRQAADGDGCLYMLPPPDSDRSAGPGAEASGDDIPWAGLPAALTVLGVGALAWRRDR